MQITDPVSIVIFGASGDLTRRKLLPALFHLYCKRRLPAQFQIIGAARTEWDTITFRDEMNAGIQQYAPDIYTEEKWDDFVKTLQYLPLDLTMPADFDQLEKTICQQPAISPNRLYYLAISPRFFTTTIQQLGAHKMITEDVGWRRVVIEKPFGRDLASANQLNQDVHQILKESQIYRIDHYLAKETVQNLLVFRFGNTIFEPVWNRTYVDSVQITAAETVDVGHRAGYYDQSGIFRDMFQNHLLQLLSLVAMEPPASFNADAIRNEKAKLLSAVRPIPLTNVANHAVRARYEGYKDADGVAPDSTTPTYAALKLFVDNWRWQGVPFYLRSGKALKRKMTEVIIQFREPPHMMFPLPAEYIIPSNQLAICIQPDEGIHLSFQAKVPDTEAEMRTVDMNFHYEEDFRDVIVPEAYERLLLEALEGDASLFARADEIELAWEIVDPILAGLSLPTAPPMAIYEKGSWGPSESDEFLARNKHHWMYSCSAKH